MSFPRPSDEQQAILDLGLDSIRVRAGAGTGKTTTVAMVIANLVENHGVNPEQVLGITFTNKAAAELADRVRSALGTSVDPGREVEVHTYHGFAAQILAEFGVLAGVDSRAQVITPTFSRQLMSDTFHHTRYRHLDITSPHGIDRIRKLGDRLGDHLLSPDELIAAAPDDQDDPEQVWRKRIEMAETLRRYSEDKRHLGVVDYADLVTMSTGVMRDHPELAALVRGRYRVVLLDEYQDTNPAQRTLLTSVFADGFPVIAVGDEDQTIYEWRGASSENFEQFPFHFPRADRRPAHDRTLRLNRRSGQGILDIASLVRRTANPAAQALEAAEPIATEVTTSWASDALAEAETVARWFERLHETGARWRDMAILFRKNKDFAVMVDVLGRHDIPVEVANIGGLLSVPEVSELRAWLTILEHPEDSTALVQILFGSKYRLGLADLAPLSSWAGRGITAEDSEDPEPVTLIEAIEQAGSVDGVRKGALAPFDRFIRTYRDLLVDTQGASLVEISRLILDKTRAWQDVEALPESRRLTARLNIYRFLDLAEDWSPLKGRPSTRAFLEYLSAMEDEPADELDSARLSGEDAVTLVTIHRSKGLEWENVAIPAATKGNFPSKTQQHPDPFRFPEHLPGQLRIDGYLDGFPTDRKIRDEFLRERHDAQEWRVAYVAVTRAKRRLLVTGSYWYGLPEPTKTPREPSPLFDLIRDQPGTVDGGQAPLGPRPAALTTSTDAGAPDPLFPGGWETGLRDAMADPVSMQRLAAEQDVAVEFQDALSEMTERLFRLAEPEEGEEPGIDRMISVTGLVTYSQCPKRYYWTDVDRLPRRPNPAAVRGTEIHRRIELHQRGQVPFEEFADIDYDVVDDLGDAGVSGYQAYLESRFATSRAALVEAPFTIGLDSGFSVRGRIDAIYADGPHWEVVDFKSGRPGDDPNRIVQLQAYAVAVDDVDFGVPTPTSIDVTFAHLGGGISETTIRATPAWVAQARESITTLTRSIEAKRFDPTPGTWCRHCDFTRFCPAGREWLEEMEAGR